MVVHCSTEAEAMGLNPVKALKIFFGPKFPIVYSAYVNQSFILSFRSPHQKRNFCEQNFDLKKTTFYDF